MYVTIKPPENFLLTVRVTDLFYLLYFLGEPIVLVYTETESSFVSNSNIYVMLIFILHV